MSDLQGGPRRALLAPTGQAGVAGAHGAAASGALGAGVRAAVWAELERRGVSIATAPFRGRAGQGGEIDVIRLQRVREEEPHEVRLWPDSDELANALAAPGGTASERSPDNRSCAPR